MADGNRQGPMFSPPLDSVTGQNAADPFADRGQHFLAAAVQDDEELIVRPAPHEIGSPERAFERACDYTQ